MTSTPGYFVRQFVLPFTSIRKNLKLIRLQKFQGLFDDRLLWQRKEISNKQ